MIDECFTGQYSNGYVWEGIYNINQVMQKTKLISKDFIRDCRVGRERERRQHTIYNLPPGQEQEDLLPIPDCHSIHPQEDSYSIEDFIQNLQAEQFIYYNDPIDDYAAEDQRPPYTRPIDQINQAYLTRIAETTTSSDTEPEQPQNMQRVNFGGEIRAKYFRDDDAPSVIGESQEYEYAMEQEGEMVEI